MVEKNQCISGITKLVVDRIIATNDEWKEIGRIPIELKVGEIVTYCDFLNNTTNIGVNVKDSKGVKKGWYPLAVFSLLNKIHEVW